MRLYLSGPMSGIEGFNVEEFNRVAAILRAAGHEVVNPAELNPPERPWAECLEVDLAALEKCHAVATLRGYNGHEGCRQELWKAFTRAMPIGPWWDYLEVP